jgi:hypothetical protein
MQAVYGEPHRLEPDGRTAPSPRQQVATPTRPAYSQVSRLDSSPVGRDVPQMTGFSGGPATEIAQIS